LDSYHLCKLHPTAYKSSLMNPDLNALCFCKSLSAIVLALCTTSDWSAYAVYSNILLMIAWWWIRSCVDAYQRCLFSVDSLWHSLHNGIRLARVIPIHRRASHSRHAPDAFMWCVSSAFDILHNSHLSISLYHCIYFWLSSFGRGR
jgi:hypothetical protein